MFSKSSSKTVSNENIILDFVKGIIVSSLISLGLVILFAFCLKWFSLSDIYISPVILAIKGISVIIGAIIAIKGNNKGLLKGLCFGILFMLIAFFMFSLLAGVFIVDVSTVLDFLFASLAGGIVGIIKVNKNN